MQDSGSSFKGLALKEGRQQFFLKSDATPWAWTSDHTTFCGPVRLPLYGFVKENFLSCCRCWYQALQT